MDDDIISHEDGVGSTASITTEADPKKQFLSLCREARSLNKETQKLVGLVARNILKLGQTLYRAKVAYESMTGTGHGRRRKVSGLRSFDEEITKRTGISRAHVLRYCQVGKLSTETASMIEGRKLAGNLSGLLRLTQVQGIASLPELTQAVDAFEAGGRNAMDVVLDRAAPKMRETKTIPAANEAALEVVAPSIKTNDSALATRGLPLNVPSELPAAEAAALPTGTPSIPSIVTVAPAPPPPEVIEIPVVNGLGADTFMGAKIWVQIVPAKKRKGGLAVRISNTALDHSRRRPA